MLQLHIQSLLLAILHDQLIIVASKINLLLALISTLEVNVNLDKIPTTYIIHFTNDIIYIRFLKSTLEVFKLESNKKKAQDLLRKEKVEKKELRIKIKKLQDELLKVDGKSDKGAVAQRLFDEKEKDVQVLKKKLKIPSTQLIQTSELTDFEKEKEALSTELIDFKSKLLKLEEQEKHCERGAKLLIENEKDLKTKLAAREKELQEKCEEVKNKFTVPSVEIDATSLSKAMSQVNLKDVELIDLKQWNKNLEETILKREQEKKEVEENTKK